MEYFNSGDGSPSIYIDSEKYSLSSSKLDYSILLDQGEHIIKLEYDKYYDLASSLFIFENLTIEDVEYPTFDYLNNDIFNTLLDNNLKKKKEIIENFTTIKKLKQEILKTRKSVLPSLKKFCTNTSLLLNNEIKKGKKR